MTLKEAKALCKKNTDYKLEVLIVIPYPGGRRKLYWKLFLKTYLKYPTQVLCNKREVDGNYDKVSEYYKVQVIDYPKQSLEQVVDTQDKKTNILDAIKKFLGMACLVAALNLPAKAALAAAPTPTDEEVISACVETVDKYKSLTLSQEDLILALKDSNQKLVKELAEGRPGVPWYYRGLLTTSIGALGGVALRPQAAAEGALTGSILGLAIWLLSESTR